MAAIAARGVCTRTTMGHMESYACGEMPNNMALIEARSFCCLYFVRLKDVTNLIDLPIQKYAVL